MVEFKETTYSDLIQILELYNYYIKNSLATFHMEPLSLDDIQKALPLNHNLYKTYTVFSDGDFCGYCYLGNYKPRQAYNRSAEITLYLKPEFQKKGIGQQTLEYLENYAANNGIKNLIGVITYENTGSIRLFTKMGYKQVGLMKNIGEKFNRILDVAIFQKEI